MSAQIIPFPAPSERDRDVTVATNPFGGCPHCGRSDVYLNDRRDHWFFCDRHKTKWLVGSNLFSSWHDEDEDTWRQNRFKLAEYMTVELIHAGSP